MSDKFNVKWWPSDRHAFRGMRMASRRMPGLALQNDLAEYQMSIVFDYNGGTNQWRLRIMGMQTLATFVLNENSDYWMEIQ